jgi:cellulose synthase/poly-beta-1,6-N-acetylglucosamine synthase-like glycosyltransferase
MGKLQSLEYKIIRFSRKLLQYVDGIYATPGPLVIYRKTAFDDVGGFDTKNWTEDIEITWHLQMKGYKIMMSTGSFVYCQSPESLRVWFKQRNRWNVGGLQTIIKYNKYWFRKGTLGNFILPFFVLSWVTSIIGMLILIYRLIKSFISEILVTKYSLVAESSLVNFGDINLVPNVLVFFGFAVFALTLISSFIALKKIQEKDYKFEGIFSLFVFLIFYVMVWPIVLIISTYKLITGKTAWR